jgi:transcriptional regulator with XRE-family HTH domain
MTQSLSFGEYLKTVRLSQHISLTKAAKRMGMTPQKLSDIESGRRFRKQISIGLVTLAAKAYGVSIAEIIRATETAVHNERTVTELLAEAIPVARMAELLAMQNLESAKLYSHEQETLALELHKRVADLRALLAAMRRRHLPNATESTLDPIQENEDL